MKNQDQFATIDSNDLLGATGGWNPFKKVVDKAKEIGKKVVDTAEKGVDYVKDHPEILLQHTKLM